METRKAEEIQTNDIIQLDIDTSIDNVRFKRIADILRYQYKILDVEVYNTENGYHVYIKIDRLLEDLELVSLQILYGSDIYREAHNLKRIKEDCWDNWNLLFQRKEIYNPSLTDKLREMMI